MLTLRRHYMIFFFPLDTWQKFVSGSDSVVSLLVLTNNVPELLQLCLHLITTLKWLQFGSQGQSHQKKKKEYSSNGENTSLSSLKVCFKMNWLRLSWNGFFWQDWKINVTESQSCTKFLLFQNLKSLSAKGTYQSKEYRRVKRKEQEKYYDKLARASEEKEAFLKQDFITWEESGAF